MPKRRSKASESGRAGPTTCASPISMRCRDALPRSCSALFAHPEPPSMTRAYRAYRLHTDRRPGAYLPERNVGGMNTATTPLRRTAVASRRRTGGGPVRMRDRIACARCRRVSGSRRNPVCSDLRHARRADQGRRRPIRERAPGPSTAGDPAARADGRGRSHSLAWPLIGRRDRAVRQVSSAPLTSQVVIRGIGTTK